MQQMSIAALPLVLMVISGLADAQGFIHASSMWQNGKLILPEAMKSVAGFGAGIVTYWICIRFLQAFKILSPEIQTLIWFTVTIIGVAIVSGKFLQWRLVDQIVGVMVILSVAWLLLRTADYMGRRSSFPSRTYHIRFNHDNLGTPLPLIPPGNGAAVPTATAVSLAERQPRQGRPLDPLWSRFNRICYNRLSSHSLIAEKIRSSIRSFPDIVHGYSR